MKKITIKHAEGSVNGIYISAGSKTPLVIIINGHNGFYNYGMFPYIQSTFAANGISSFSFNFSHGGVTGDGDNFDDLEKYAKNCMRLEMEDLLCVLNNLHSGVFEEHSKTVLLAHSLGGVPTLFGATKALTNGITIDGIVLVSTVRTLNFWPKDMIEEWKQHKIFYKKNNRTKQYLPQGPELLEEILKSGTEWNVEKTIEKLRLPLLIIHGENDEAIPVEHAHSLYKWGHANPNVTLHIIANATHTYNTKHPFEETTPQLEELIDTTARWIREIV